MSRKKKVYYFANSTMIYFDKFVPIILELARQGNMVYTVLVDRNHHKRMKENVTYFSWLKKLTTVNLVVADDGGGFFGRAGTAVGFLQLLLSMLFSRHYLAFFDSKNAHWSTRILSRIATLRGRSILYTGGFYVEVLQEITQEKVDAEREKLQKRSKEKNFRYNYCDKVLVYHESYIKQIREIPCSKYVVCRHPKMQKWWGTFLDQHPPVFDNEDVARADRFITVLLTHQGNYFFEEGTDLDTFLTEIFEAIRTVYPDELIVLKPKVSVDLNWLKTFLAEQGVKNVTVSNTPVSLLSLKSICAVSVCMSTAQHEFSVSGVPWIEYGRYSEFWKGFYPPVTYSEKFGGFFIQNIEDLKECLEGIEKFRFDMDAFKKALDFQEQQPTFEMFYND